MNSKTVIRWSVTERTDEAGAAEFLGVSTRALRRYRAQGRGPAFYAVGGRVWYLRKDLEDYVEQRRHDPFAA